MLYDPSTARFTWANAGHPAPMLAEGRCGPTGRVTVLDDHDVALGLSGSTYSRWTVTVPRGSALCCYTDGLVERRGSTPERDQARLADALGRATAVAVDDSGLTHARARRLVDTLTADLLGPESPADDVCVFVLLR
jgi:serine phosphatase RsbU (regulator of sigma subunit)